MLKYSDAFSVVYFRYNEKEKFSLSAKKVKKELEDFIIYEKSVNQWPGTITLNETGQIYLMTMYRTDMAAETTLLRVKSIWEWDYPKYPMDLAFFKDGYAWFESTAHEGINLIHIKDQSTSDDLEKLGIVLTPIEFKSELFYDRDSLLANKKQE